MNHRHFSFSIVMIALILICHSVLATEPGTGQPSKNSSQQWEWVFLGAPLGYPDVDGILVDPEDENILYVSSINTGLYVTHDGGQTWQHPLDGRGLDAEGIQIDPFNPAKVYASLWEKLYISEDKGLTWNLSYTCPEYIRSIHVSERDSSIYLAPQTEENPTPGIYKSTTGGSNFAHLPFGVSQQRFLCWDIEEDAQDGILYVGVEIADHPQPYNPPFFRSTDGGNSWEETSGTLSWHGVKIQINPQNHDVYYLIERGGLFKSTNYGTDWQVVNYVYGLALLMDVRYPNRLYVGDSKNYGDGGAYFSQNYGEVFSPIGPEGISITAMALNNSSTVLYAASYGSGLWKVQVPDLETNGNILVTNTEDNGANSLREAMSIANANLSADTIRFAIPETDPGFDPASGTWTIHVQEALPAISSDDLFIDGTSQAEFIGSDSNPDGPEIVIDGANAAPYAHGFHIQSAANVIRNLVIHGFGGSAVWIDGAAAHSNVLSGNYLGTDATGKSAMPNLIGVYITNAPLNRIGGIGAENRNIISGNSTDGIGIYGASTQENTVSGNYIGTDVLGTTALGNSAMGITVAVGNGTTIGGSQAGAGNLISGNKNDGIRMSSDHNRILGNKIGTNISGTAALGNSWDGISITSGKFNQIGGLQENERNLISGNGKSGINISQSARENSISGNYIGTDESGNDDIGNIDSGIFFSYGPRKNTVGPENRIAFNSNGIVAYADSTVQNTFTENSIFSNQSNGILHLEGGNTDLLAPTILAAGDGVVSGTIVPLATVEIFSDDEGQGKFFEGSVPADESGNFAWAGVPAGPYVTATATDTAGNTSMFSSAFSFTAVKESQSGVVPTEFSLSQNYPNPFNPTTTIKFSIPAGGFVSLDAFDLLGKKITSIVNDVLTTGDYSVEFDGSELSSGVYFFRLQINEFVCSKKALLLK